MGESRGPIIIAVAIIVAGIIVAFAVRDGQPEPSPSSASEPTADEPADDGPVEVSGEIDFFIGDLRGPGITLADCEQLLGKQWLPFRLQFTSSSGDSELPRILSAETAADAPRQENGETLTRCSIQGDYTALLEPDETYRPGLADFPPLQPPPVTGDQLEASGYRLDLVWNVCDYSTTC